MGRHQLHCGLKMKCAIVLCSTVLASCIRTSNRPQDLADPLPPGKIVAVGQDTYEIRVTNEPVDIAEARSRDLADDYCSKMNKAMVPKVGVFNMGYGYVLTWNCVKLQHGVDHR